MKGADHPGAPSRTLLLLLTLLIVQLPIAQVPIANYQAVPPPTATPDSATGLAIYDQRCATCHGPAGAGDGELAADLPNPPAVFDAAWAETAVPTDLFTTITRGRLQNGMPLFGPGSSNPLSEAERWDAIAALYSLATPPETIAAGQALYEASCVECHGPAGDALPEANLADPTYWFDRSNAAVAEQVNQLPAAHPLTLNAADAAEVVAYARTLSFTYVDAAARNAPLPRLDIEGLVTNATTDERLTEGTALLRIFGDSGFVSELSAPLDDDGRYRFELTDVPRNQVYIVGVDYAGLVFNSNIGRADAASPALDLPVSVFETTDDPGGIRIANLQIILEFVGDRVRVNEFYRFANDGDRVYVGSPGAPGVAVSLPATASNPTFQRSFSSFQDFLPADDVVPSAAGWRDPTPVFPGAGTLTLLARYEMAYESGLVVAHPVRYPVAAVDLVLPDVGVTAGGAGWTAISAQNLPEGHFLTYTRGGLPAGSDLSLTLDGRPRQVQGAGGTVLVRDETTELLVGGIALLLAVAAGAVVIAGWRRREQGATAEAREALLDALVALEDDYAAGTIPDETYRQRRTTLIARLAEGWDK